MFKFFKNKKRLSSKIFGVLFLGALLFEANTVNAYTWNCGGSVGVNDKYLVPVPNVNFPNPLCLAAEFTFGVVLSGSAAITGLSGQLLDEIIKYTIFDAKKNMFPNNSGANYIDQAWKIFRDIVNILFIFVIVYIGIMTIVKGVEFGTKKLLTTVIVVAVLLNFSLFFTKTFIDFGNVLAIQINESLTKSANFNSDLGAGGFILEGLGLYSIYNLSKSAPARTIYIDGGDPGAVSLENMLIRQEWGRAIIYFLFASLVLLVTALILFVATFLFVARYIVLIFILLLSSAAFGSHILPKLKSQIWDKWFSTLIGQTFFAPAFLLLFTISAFVINVSSNSIRDTSETYWGNLFSFDPTTMASAILNILIPFFVIIGFLVGTIIFSKKLSDMGGSYAGDVTKFVAGKALGVTAFAGRRLGGNVVGGLLTSTVAKNLANNPNSRIARTIGGAALAVGNKARKGNWDIRSGGFGISKVLDKTGVNLGDASKKSVESVEKDIKKKQDERAERRVYTDEQKAKIEEEMKKNNGFVIKDDDPDSVKEHKEKTTETLEKEIKTLEESVKTEKDLIATLKKENETHQREVDALEKRKAGATLAEQIDLTRLQDGLREKININKTKSETSEKTVAEKEKGVETRNIAKARIKDEIDNRIKNVKANYYANMAGRDPKTGKPYEEWSTDRVVGGITRINPFNWTRNSVARASYRKAKKEPTEQEKLAKEIAKIMKAEKKNEEGSEKKDK